MIRSKIKSLVKTLLDRVVGQWHRRRMHTAVQSLDLDHKAYLESQLNRTFLKRKQNSGIGIRILVNKLVEIGSPLSGKKVLCIGCRNTKEIEYFEGQGAEVVGIDLFSNSSKVRVMDMHRMSFVDNEFDVVFSCHSLEHSRRIEDVVGEIARISKPGALVAIEVPVQFATTAEDLIDFGDLDGLIEVFMPYMERVVWSDEQQPRTDYNEHGSSIVRLVFSVKKMTPIQAASA